MGTDSFFGSSALDSIVPRSGCVGLWVPAASGFVLSPLEREKERKGGQNAKSHGTASRILRFPAESTFFPQGEEGAFVFGRAFAFLLPLRTARPLSDRSCFRYGEFRSAGVPRASKTPKPGSESKRGKRAGRPAVGPYRADGEGVTKDGETTS